MLFKIFFSSFDAEGKKFFLLKETKFGFEMRTKKKKIKRG